jgi:hypothetical protein
MLGLFDTFLRVASWASGIAAEVAAATVSALAI